MFLVHADWSIAPTKRWVARAEQRDSGWLVSQLEPVGAMRPFLTNLLRVASDAPVVAGFDFPVGVPAGYGERTGLDGFKNLLDAVGHGAWKDFASIGNDPSQISLHRPFYPRNNAGPPRQRFLVDALEVTGMDELLRTCERKTADRRAACSVFWTLGGNQVGRAALAGWLEFVRPALAEGAMLWPFDGPLLELVSSPRLIVAETYPTEAYGHVGVKFDRSESKTRQDDRRTKEPSIRAWASANHILFSPSVEAELANAFGDGRDGEDRFDALLGLFGMIEVVDGRRSDGAAQMPPLTTWEGWILGQSGKAPPQEKLLPREVPRTGITIDHALVRSVLTADEPTRRAILEALDTQQTG